jgi:alpha-glucosidase
VKDQSVPWLQGAVIYQIYPRSFFDPKATGVGSLKGIIDKLDYFGGTNTSLGVSALWISPIYPSPMADFGYDVSNHTDVDPIFGTLDDLKRLVSEAHSRDLKIILDLVPNHTSDEHPWFVESKSSLTNPKRNWYTWRDPGTQQTTPNNWLSVFGGSAWEFSEETGQYYLHTFLKKQPDLNWDNPELREAMKSVMRFWLDLGVDGFRVDAVDWLSKDPEFKDDPEREQVLSPVTAVSDYYDLVHSASRDGPHLFDRLNEMTEVLKEYDECFMITEAHPETTNKIQGYLQYYKSVNPHLSAPFNFEGIYLPWKAQAFRNFVDKFQAVMKPGYMPIYTVGNHDESRIASRIGYPAARVAAMMLLTLPGMAFIYYGEELGMTNITVDSDARRDPVTIPGRNRDPQRSPMQWNTAAHAGFTNGTPWLPVSELFHVVNVETESKDPLSFL